LAFASRFFVFAELLPKRSEDFACVVMVAKPSGLATQHPITDRR
jgi:hypothetical protein